MKKLIEQAKPLERNSSSGNAVSSRLMEIVKRKIKQ